MTVGVDYGTLRVGPSSSGSPTARSSARPSATTRTRSSTGRCPPTGRADVGSAPTGPSRCPPTTSRCCDRRPRRRRRGRRPGARSSASPPTSPPARWCPRLADGTPLCELPSSPPSRTPTSSCGSTTPPSRRPTASTSWPPQARRGLAARYGGLISSEWEFAKGLQLLEEAPRSTPRWSTWSRRPTGSSGSCAAVRPQRLHGRLQGHLPGRRVPDADFLAALNPDFETFVHDKLEHPTRPARGAAGGSRAGGRVDRPARGHRRRGRQRRRARHRAGRRRDRRRPDGRDHGHLDLPRDEQRHPARGPGHVRGRRRRHHRRLCGATRPVSPVSATSSTGSSTTVCPHGTPTRRPSAA